jgi:hypothetical protein
MTSRRWPLAWMGMVFMAACAVQRDTPMRGLAVRLVVRKRRFSCRPCGRPFTEPVPGIRKGYRTTERYQRSVLWACENFSDLTQVRRVYRCSSGYLYKALYTQLELQRRKRLYPWPAVVGLDEHFSVEDHMGAIEDPRVQPPCRHRSPMNGRPGMSDRDKRRTSRSFSLSGSLQPAPR